MIRMGKTGKSRKDALNRDGVWERGDTVPLPIQNVDQTALTVATLELAQ